VPKSASTMQSQAPRATSRRVGVVGRRPAGHRRSAEPRRASPPRLRESAPGRHAPRHTCTSGEVEPQVTRDHQPVAAVVARPHQHRDVVAAASAGCALAITSAAPRPAFSISSRPGHAAGDDPSRRWCAPRRGQQRSRSGESWSSVLIDSNTTTAAAKPASCVIESEQPASPPARRPGPRHAVPPQRRRPRPSRASTSAWCQWMPAGTPSALLAASLAAMRPASHSITRRLVRHHRPPLVLAQHPGRDALAPAAPHPLDAGQRHHVDAEAHDHFAARPPVHRGAHRSAPPRRCP
jgi:hypothetical protein